MVLSVLALMLIALNNYAKSAITQKLSKIFNDVGLEYKTIDVNLLARNVDIRILEFQLNTKRLKANSIKLKSFSVYEYLINDIVEFDEVVICGPQLTVSKEYQNNKKDSVSKKGNQFNKNILIGKLIIEKASLRILKDSTPENQFYSRLELVEFKDVRMTSTSIKEKIPFHFQNYKIRADSIYYKLNKEHDLIIGSIEIEDGVGEILDVNITPIYSKKEFHRYIPYQKDRMELEIAALRFNSLQGDFKKDSLWVQNSLIVIRDLKLDVYRDHLERKDHRRKYLYSKLIRDLPIKLRLDTVKVENASIWYEERFERSEKPGVVDFKNLYTSIYNLSNVDMYGEDFADTYIDVNTRFLGEAYLLVRWHFNSSDRNDGFKISGNLGALSASSMNKFLKPAMNVETSGEIRNMSFDLAGNKTSATGEVKLDYSNFKVMVLRKGSSKKNKVVSALANLIIKNKAVSEKAKVHKVKVQRDLTKSFWNFLWKSIREGVLKTFL